MRTAPKNKYIYSLELSEEKEVVNVIQFMLSDNSSMVTGIAMPVDGGFTC